MQRVGPMCHIVLKFGAVKFRKYDGYILEPCDCVLNQVLKCPVLHNCIFWPDQIKYHWYKKFGNEKCFDITELMLANLVSDI
ncbi:hypothetical protein BpHYR1_003004 [Brachionus plicatilis]|uniref:Uncharacterized protein n=1 Tax=Brachionus plicatilis TaxID=10195 RepID=A0A3M7RJK4_BRAPC|nr:hypothetical protein BpHYR1_003004 [Brachionus plicatilis]